MDRAITTALNPIAAWRKGTVHRYSSAAQGLFLAADVLAFFASFYVAMGLVDRTWTWRSFELLVGVSAWLSIGLWIVMFASLGMYRRSVALTPRDEFYYTVAALLIGITPELLLFTLVPSLNTSRLLLLVAAGCAVLSVGGCRAIIRPAVKAAEGRAARRVLVVTFGEQPASVPQAGTLSSRTNVKCYPCDFAAASGDSPQAIFERISWFRTAMLERCDCIVVDALLPERAATHTVALAAGYGIRIAFAPRELQGSAYDLRVEREGNGIWLAPVRLSVLEPAADFCKTLFDRTCALLALALLSGFLMVIALAIRLESPGPVFFRQERVGRGGRTFRICKFRSMRTDASSDWARPNDTRITRIGRFIRRFSIDELPQLINVLRGEMSLVGPRPEMSEYAERFSRLLPRYPERHLVRPGITGWSQINMRRNLTPDDAEEVLENDLFYIQNWSFLLDLSILLKTAIEFVFHRGV